MVDQKQHEMEVRRESDELKLGMTKLTEMMQVLIAREEPPQRTVISEVVTVVVDPPIVHQSVVISQISPPFISTVKNIFNIGFYNILWFNFTNILTIIYFAHLKICDNLFQIIFILKRKYLFSFIYFQLGFISNE